MAGLAAVWRDAWCRKTMNASKRVRTWAVNDHCTKVGRCDTKRGRSSHRTSPVAYVAAEACDMWRSIGQVFVDRVLGAHPGAVTAQLPPCSFLAPADLHSPTYMIVA